MSLSSTTLLVFGLEKESTPKSLSDSKQPAFMTVPLHECADTRLGVKFLCDGDWSLETDKGAVLIGISEKPEVSMTLLKNDAPVMALELLSPQALKGLGHYEDGFSSRLIKLNGQDVLKMEGAMKDVPDTYVMDFYLIHDVSLYGILFTISPQKHFPEFKPLLITILKSFAFLEDNF